MKWEEMKPRERDARCAALLNMPPFPEGSDYSQDYPDGWIAFTEDLKYARLVEDEIARRGLQDEYANELMSIIDPDGAEIFTSAIEVDRYTSPLDTGSKLIFAVVTATADQRCHAAVRACGVDV